MRLEVIAGPMFSGKSEELARRLKRSAYANKKILLIKPGVDDRDERNIFHFIKEDRKLSVYENLEMRVVNSSKDFASLINPPRFDVLAIDEAQFFGKWLLKALTKMIQIGCRLNITVIVSGLDMDAWQRPFGIMPQLLALADDVQKLTAICLHCQGQNGPAIFTHKKGKSIQQVEVGNTDLYEARCRVCHIIPEIPK